MSFFGHTILQQGIFVVSDARRHPWFRDNPLVTGDPNIGFYAGAPVRAPNQRVVGSLCTASGKAGVSVGAAVADADDGEADF